MNEIFPLLLPNPLSELKSYDIINIIPIIHGGSQKNINFNINNLQIGLFEINKSHSNKEYLLSLREKFTKLINIGSEIYNIS